MTFYVALRQYLRDTPEDTESAANARSAIAAFGGSPAITLAELTASPLAAILDEAEITVRAGRISPALTAAEDQINAALRNRDGTGRES
jgi:hypothetical protein